MLCVCVCAPPPQLIGVWVLSEWMGAGRPKHLQLVELGPGKGSMSSDVLRVRPPSTQVCLDAQRSEVNMAALSSLQVLGQLRSVLGEASVSLHLVEVSPALSRLQAEKLTGSGSREADNEDEPVYRRGETKDGLPVSWYRNLDDVPAGRGQTTTDLSGLGLWTSY